MKRAPRPHVTNLYGMTGVGRTSTDAKHDAERQIEQALDGSYTPSILRFPAGYVGIVTRCHPRQHPKRWEYFYMQPGEEQSSSSPYTCSAFDTPAEAERALRKHISQLLIGAIEDDGMSVLIEDADKRSHADYIDWQAHYRELRSQGYDDTAAHRMACYGREVAQQQALLQHGLFQQLP